MRKWFLSLGVLLTVMMLQGCQGGSVDTVENEKVKEGTVDANTLTPQQQQQMQTAQPPQTGAPPPVKGRR